MQSSFGASRSSLNVPPTYRAKSLGPAAKVERDFVRFPKGPGQINDTTFKGVVQESEKMLSPRAYNMSATTLIFNIWLTLSILVFNAGCVTVKLANETGKKASGVSLREPAKPFNKESRADVDASWKNGKNGNVISYISDCGDPTDPPLEQIVNGVVSGLGDMKAVEESTPMVQDREGRRVHVAGKVDGVPTEIDLLTFKRNHCIYILTLVGVKKAFTEDRVAFNKFIDGFRAP